MNKETLFSKLNKPKLTDNILLLTHTDMDGSGASIILKSIFPSVTVKYCSNGTMSNDIKEAVFDTENNYDYIFACDISCTEDDAIEINNHPNHVKLSVIDHHLTAIGLNKYEWACVEPNLLEDSYRKQYYPENVSGLSSGTSLMYDFMEYCNLLTNVTNVEFMKTIVHMIAAYDTWDWVTVFNKNKDIETLSTLFDIYLSERFESKILNSISNILSTEDDIFDDTDRLLLEIEKDKIDIYLKNIAKAFHTGTIKLSEIEYTIVFCTSDKYLQDTFESMKSLYPNYDMYIINYGTGIALRAVKDDINVGLIAKEFGGGGHPGAGGFKIPLKNQIKVIETAFASEITLNE